MATRQEIARHYIELNNLIDLPNWRRFVYIYIPNNWLKMHGYPKKRRRKKL